MALTAFTSRLGTTQGRILQGQGSAGEYAFVLGDTDTGRLTELSAGDFAQISQHTDLTEVSFVRVKLSLRVPQGLPSGLAWIAAILIDGVRAASTSAASGQQRAITDLCANVSKLTGIHEVAVRLELVNG